MPHTHHTPHRHTPSPRYTLAAEHDATLERWHAAIGLRMPLKPVEALCKGWLFKRADLGGGWKDRYFVLLRCP